MSTGFDWGVFRDVAVGVGVFLAGLGVFIACVALARVFRRLNGTLDVADEQLRSLSKPVAQTLTHVGGIADTADKTIAKLASVAGALEQVAGTAASAAKLTQEAVSPAIVNVGATLGGISAGLRRLIRGSSDGSKPEV